MNEKLFNFSILFLFIMVGINGFLTMGSSLVDQDGQQLPLFLNMANNDLNYTNLDVSPQFGVDETATSSLGDSRNGFTWITDVLGLPFAVAALTQYIFTLTFGVQLVLLSLNSLFGGVFAPLFYIIIGIVTIIQALGFVYLASIVARAIFGRAI